MSASVEPVGIWRGLIVQWAFAISCISCDGAGAPCPPVESRVGWQPDGACGTTRALIPSWCSFAFAPATPLDRLIEIVSVPSWLRATANAGEVLAALSTSASAVPTPARPRVEPASTPDRARLCLVAGRPSQRRR